MSVSDAVGAWSNMEQFADNIKIGAPAVSNGGFAWLTSFLEQCTNCKIDFLPIHWYDSNNDFDYFKSYITQVHNAAPDYPIWLTEFAATGSLEVQTAFAQQAMEYLDSLDYVERYAYFMLANGDLATNGSPNQLGSAYIS